MKCFTNVSFFRSSFEDPGLRFTSFQSRLRSKRPISKAVLISKKIKTFHFGEFFAAPQKDDRSQENESKELRTGVDFDGQFSGTLDVRNFSRVNTGKSAIVFSFRFQ
ncbi:unnamed protein product [Rhizophagus irregularis]|nr:unnamed protein product [Rhizophagus irregularis]